MTDLNPSLTRSAVSSLRFVQAFLVILALLYFLRGYFVAQIYGVDFPFWLTMGVGVVLLPAVLLFSRPRAWLPTMLALFSAAAVVVNVIMTIIEWHGLNVIVLIAVVIIALWLVLLGLSLRPNVRRNLGAI